MELLQLLKRLPLYYRKSRVILEILRAHSLEVTALNEAVRQAQDDFFATTTEKSIERWESDFSLKPAPAFSLEERRSRVLARIQRDAVTTKESIKRLVASYDGGDVEVVENFSGYAITITIANPTAAPAGMQDMLHMVSVVRPAHLAVNYIFRGSDFANLYTTAALTHTYTRTRVSTQTLPDKIVNTEIYIGGGNVVYSRYKEDLG